MLTELPSRSEEPGKEGPQVNTTVEKLLGSIQEPAGLSLSRARLALTSQKRPQGTIYTASFDYPIGGNAFMSFLNEVAPVEVRYASVVLGDWVMPDEARGDDHTYNNTAKSRLRRHGTMGKDWADFEANRKDFLEILKDKAHVDDLEDKTRDLLVFPDSNTTVEAIYQYIQSRTIQVGLSPFASIRGEDMTVYEFVDKIRNDIVEYMNSNPGFWNDKQLKNKTNQIPAAALNRFWNASRGLAINFLKKHPLTNELCLNPEFVQTAIGNAMKRKGHMIGKDRKGETVYFKDSKIDYYPVTQKNDGDVFIGDLDNPFIIATVDVSEAGDRSLNIKYVKPARESRPILRWQTTKEEDGKVKRTLLIKPLPMDKAPGASLVGNNPLLGFLATAYLEPKLREGWEEELYIDAKDENGNDKRYGPQINGPAQIPVYALMQREVIAAYSKLLPAAEKYFAENVA